MGATAEKAGLLARLDREQLLDILEHLPYATGVFDADFRYVYYNPAGERMSGIPLQQAIGKAPAEIVPAAVLERMLPLLEQVKTSREKTEATLDFDFGQGKIYLHLVYAPIIDEANNLTGILGITEDVTAAKTYELQLALQANHDALTGLANRTHLGALVEKHAGYAPSRALNASRASGAMSSPCCSQGCRPRARPKILPRAFTPHLQRRWS